jgi:DNA (cytosine-5)-methyltransferase 1
VSKREFTVLSLFSGGMGLDIGLEKAGKFRLLACVEKIPAFCETIRRNRDAGRLGSGDLKVYETDISELQPMQVMQDLALAPGDLDLLVGGPPCQTFSTTGKRATVQDPRGTLLWQFLRFVEEIKPKMFVMENVRGLMSAALRHRPIKDRPDKGGAPLEPDEEPGSVIQRFLRDLRYSYRIDCFEVNAVNYGAPQLRERSIFIGNRFNRLVEFPGPTHGQRRGAQPQLALFDGSVENDDGLKPFSTLREALAGLVETNPAIMDFSPRKKRYLAMVPEGSNWRSLPTEIAKESMGKAYFAKGGRSGWWRRLTFDLPCPTIVTMPNHAGTSLCHPTETRALTLRECARVQQFPDDWEFCGTTQEKYAQVGNAVPVRLGEVCGELVANELTDLYETGLKGAEGNQPPYRIVYVKSHIRTRQWFKGGETFVWRHGEANGHARYRPAKTERKVKLPPRE